MVIMDIYIKEQIELNWFENIPREKLASQLNISLGTLYEIAKKLNLEINKKFSGNAKSPRWTKEEKDIFKKNYPCKTIKELSDILGRSEASITNKLKQFNIKKNYKWTEEEVKLLKLFYSDASTKEIRLLFPNHSLGSINKKAKELNLIRKNTQVWRQEEIEFLKKLVNDGLSDKEISIQINRGIEGVKRIRQIYCREKFDWSEEEINILKNNFVEKPIEILVLLLPNKTKLQIRNKASKLNLKKPLLWLEEEVKLLKKVYPYKTIYELQIVFPHKTKHQINKKAKRLKLRKTEDTLARCFRTEVGKVPDLPSKRTKWRHTILKRDNYSCRLCGKRKESGIKLQIHHIKPVRDCNKEEIYDINNGVCLCLDCHIKIKNKEYSYISLFMGGS